MIEDWMNYEWIAKSKNDKASKQILEKIIAYKPRGEEVRHSVNNLITAWSLKKLGRESEAKRLLTELLAKHPDNKIAKWTLDAYNGNPSALDIEANDNYDLLLQLMANP